ncbi:hypothetical protein ASPZODRAFT_121454, partial [Penicilliopsis zonata CBS 506.65]
MSQPFNGISLDIPTAELEEMQSLRFSKRGSLIKSSPKPQAQQQPQQPQQPQPQEVQSEQSTLSATSAPSATSTEQTEQTDQAEPRVVARRAESSRRTKVVLSARLRQSTLSSRAISADEDMLSRRVRLMYEKGNENVSDAEVAKSMALENGVLWEEGAVSGTDTDTDTGTCTNGRPSETLPRVSSEEARDARDARDPALFKRESNELAGGIEYWQNIGAGDVDRYGFIRRKTNESGDGTDPNPIQRVSTSLLLASESPRRKRSTMRPPSALTSSNRSFTGRSPTRKLSDTSMRPTSSQSGYGTPLRRSTSRFRYATNHLPHNRDRRMKDEAADMLTLPQMATAGDGPDSRLSRAIRKKEWEREDKWTKMAKPTRKTHDGGGMRFEFDTQSSKLIERTWKGIPDRWRATAWYAFLEASAQRRADSPSETELIEAFHEYQYISSPDDVQIDIDVPRTITSHIMFRRRYRGGQRLLFRVLHAMSLYFPDTGYVQGMAALAATLLAYYDEEHAFIMLVRLWQLRGLERLYRSGFSGLMEALNDFEREWLESGEVAAKLEELGIPPTAYGTRWYLTLFNYSIPFPAQLRVWDVFMLLGDAEEVPVRSHAGKASSHDTTTNASSSSSPPSPSSFGRGLDVLHASSAALIDGMREIILDSDFENGMKVLTSWVPIRDVELFMRVAKAEWKVHHKKR